MSDWQRICLFLNVASEHLPRILQVPSASSVVLRSDLQWDERVGPHQEDWEDDTWVAGDDTYERNEYCGLVIAPLPLRDLDFEAIIESLASTRRAEDDVVRAIRLVKSRDPAPHVSWERSTDQSRSSMGRTIRCDMEKAWPFLAPEEHPTCILGKKDLDQVQEVLDDLARLDAAGAGEDIQRIRRAMGRFDLAWDRNREDDQIVDLAIALEAMFVSDEKSKGQVIAKRACLYLEGNYRSDHRLINDIKDWYYVRSRIAHGQSVGTELNSAVVGMRAVVRRCIRKALKDPDSLSRVRLL